MPLPLLFIGFAALAGAGGVGAAAKGYDDKNTAKKLIKLSNKKVEKAINELELQRELVSQTLENVGQLKVDVLSNEIERFVKSFGRIKNMNLKESVGLDELSKLTIDQAEFDEIKQLSDLAVDMTKGLAGGSAIGALTAFGAYSAAGSLATASTGTAIASLHGAAATNATLAYFGGGSLASGGLGIAGGQMVLGGLVAGPALLAMGIYMGVKGQEELDQALSNKAEADSTVQELSNLAFKCSAIRRRSSMFYILLTKLDHQFLPLVEQLENVLITEGDDYYKYSLNAKNTIKKVATLAKSIKGVLDTPILTKDGELTEEVKNIEMIA